MLQILFKLEVFEARHSAQPKTETQKAHPQPDYSTFISIYINIYIYIYKFSIFLYCFTVLIVDRITFYRYSVVATLPVCTLFYMMKKKQVWGSAWISCNFWLKII